MAKVTRGVLTQGTQVWIKHGSEPTLTQMQCITSLEISRGEPNAIQNTCLEETKMQTSVNGLYSEGSGSITLNVDPENQTHLTLLQLAEDMEEVEIIIGWRNGTDEPSLSVDEVTLPESRSWTSFLAELSTSSPTFEADSLVSQTINIKMLTIDVTKHKTV